MRTGIFGGAFNPPHLGHLICAQEAYEALELDSVILLAVGEAPHRDIDQDPGGDVRARLCERAIEGDARFTVSRAEIDRDGPSFTADTLEGLRSDKSDDDLVLILGADQASELVSWHEPERVLELATVAVASRGGIEREAVSRRLHGLAGHERVEFFDMPRIDISSSLVRERVAAGRSIRYLVAAGVVEEIEARALYGGTGPVAPEGA